MFLIIFYYIYVAISLTPFAIIFIIKNKIFNGFSDIFVSSGFILFSLFFSWFYIYCIKKYKNTESERTECYEIEIAEPKYIPIYIAYFVIAVSIDHWLTFIIVFILIYLLVLKGKFSFFNPYLLCFGYHFYEVSVNTKPQYKIFLISRRVIEGC